MVETDESARQGEPQIEATRKNVITVVSTRTVDCLPGEDRVEVAGGPAYYIPWALDRLGVPYRLITGIEVRTQVLSGTDGERYVIPALPLIPLPPRLEGDAVILSPVMREIEPSRVPPADGMLILDLQGFVREPGRPSGMSDRRFDVAEMVKRASVVKGSAAEISLLDERSQEALDQTVLLETRGRAGALVRFGGKAVEVPANFVPAPNTIGAGDIFLAAFSAGFVEGKDPRAAAETAARFTEACLAERLSEAAR